MNRTCSAGNAPLAVTLLALGAALCAPAGCGAGDTRPVVLVSVGGAGDNVSVLRAAAALNGVKASRSEEFPRQGSPVQLALRLPEGARGQYVLDVEGLGADRCVLSRGQGSVNIAAEGRHDLAVALVALPSRECDGVAQLSLKVTKAGDGQGTITSEPPGIECGDRCTAEFGRGQMVKLIPQAGARSRFTGWGGACQGQDVCTLPLSAAAEVTASFGTKVCGPAGFCWENPLPQGFNSFRVWGSGRNDIWAVGDGGLIFRWDGQAWRPANSGTTDSLFDVWGSSASDVWAVGNLGQVLHWDGTAWTKVSLGASAAQTRLYAVWGSAPGDIWGVGYDFQNNRGVFYRSNGSTWTLNATLMGVALYGVSGNGANNVLAVGQFGYTYQWNGTSWTYRESTVATTSTLYGVWMAPGGQAWCVGGDLATGYYNPLTVQWDGTRWQRVDAVMGGGTPEKSYNLNSVWGAAPNDVWAVGGNGFIIHFNGVNWTQVEPDTRTAFYGVWGSGPSDIVVVGYGPILRWDGRAFTQSANAGVTNWLVGLWGAPDGGVWTAGQAATVVRHNGIAWGQMPVPAAVTRNFLPALWGAALDDVWAGGDFGTLIHWDGKEWKTADSKTGSYLWGLWGSAKDDVWASGGGGTIIRWNGSAWAPVTSGTNRNLRSIWGSSKDDIWAVGTMGTVTRWNGLSFTATSNVLAVTADLYGVWGSARDDVWVVGGAGTILNFDGAAWRKLTSPVTSDLYGVWASGKTDAWAVGTGGVILHWDGQAWSRVESGTSFQLWGVWGRGPGDVYVTGYGGTILHYVRQ